MKKYLSYFVIMFFTFLFIVPSVKADSGYVSDKGGVRLRSNPTTDSNILADISYNKSFYIVSTNSGSGNGCDSNWYYVYYNSNYGYVCSTYIKIVDETNLSYSRPWTSPKKAIMGGAQFIGESYIAKGQFTSYLKKFNVNPNGSYQVYNHQYMANMRAPSSESATTYKSLNSNGLLNNSYNFIIPIYTNMPDTTYNSSIKNTGLNTAGIQDEAFENMISGFPETYKQYLRYLHTIHPNWTFNPLNTNLDFEVSYYAEKAVSSIEISSGFCEQNPYRVTESGWCIGNEASTKFFLDPRNFLSEKYIFMFENLGYTDLYNEAVVQKVLNNTFMSDLSILDNQIYSNIFVEAGKNGGVSPLYLASLAVQEITAKLTKATNGCEFEYEGYKYFGLYNFFNIGANSGASDPLFAGLVYANGGSGINNSKLIGIDDNDPKDVDQPINTDFISMLKVKENGGYISGYGIGTKISTLKENVGNQANVIVKDASGNVKTDSDLIGTGYQVQISNSGASKSYTYIMYGDINGDGEINSADLLKIRQHLLGTSVLSGANLTSAKIAGEDVNSATLLKIRQYLLGMVNIDQ